MKKIFTIAMTLSVVYVLPAAADKLTPQMICKDYAFQAIQSRNLAIEGHCQNITGDRWSPIEANHLNACLGFIASGKENIVQIEMKARQDIVSACLRTQQKPDKSGVH